MVILLSNQVVLEEQGQIFDNQCDFVLPAHLIITCSVDQHHFLINIVLRFKTTTDHHFKIILSSNILMNNVLHHFGIKIEVVLIIKGEEDVEEVVIFITEIHLIIEITTKTNNNKIDVLMVNYRHNITSSNRKKDSKELLEDHITS